MSESLADFESEHIQGLPTDDELVPIPLFSVVGQNVYMGGCPITGEIPGGTRFVVNLYPWLEYNVPEGITVTRSWMEDVDEMPDVGELLALACWVSAVRRVGPTLVHCQAGLNRSGLVVALAMMADGAPAAAAIERLRSVRSPYVLCNKTFERWLLEEAEEVLKSAGVLI